MWEPTGEDKRPIARRLEAKSKKSAGSDYRQEIVSLAKTPALDVKVWPSDARLHSSRRNSQNDRQSPTVAADQRLKEAYLVFVDL
jgi:hypothetical protein